MIAVDHGSSSTYVSLVNIFGIYTDNSWFSVQSVEDNTLQAKRGSVLISTIAHNMPLIVPIVSPMIAEFTVNSKFCIYCRFRSHGVGSLIAPLVLLNYENYLVSVIRFTGLGRKIIIISAKCVIPVQNFECW